VLDGLKQIYPEIASLQLAPDAPQHMQFLQGLTQAVQKYLQQATQQKAQQAAQMQQAQMQGAINPQMGGPGGGGAPGGPPPGGPGGPPSQGSPGIAMPNPDELRRVLSSSGAGG
jgi:hypothetical protein